MEKENQCLKSGYLLKWIIKRWKIRWFILHEDKLTCHHKTDKSVLIETVPLQGASIVCPCYEAADVVNIESAFKLYTSNGEELLFQAAGTQDRDRWAHAIGAVIRAISSANQVSNSQVKFQHFRVTANVSEVLGALQDPDAGVDMGSHMRNGVLHKNSFKGSDVIDWLLRWSIVRRRGDGSAMAQSLLKLGHLQEVDMADGTAGVSQRFKDGEKLYRFTSLNLGVKRNSYFDSSDSDSSLSDDEDDGKLREKIKKGKVAKTGFLLKKKSLRKGWRIVRVVLRECPASLEYSCPYSTASCLKDQVADPRLTKIVDLQNCCLCDSSKGTTAFLGGVKGPTHSPKNRIYLRSKGKKCRTFQVPDDEEWFEYASLLNTLCGAKPSPVSPAKVKVTQS